MENHKHKTFNVELLLDFRLNLFVFTLPNRTQFMKESTMPSIQTSLRSGRCLRNWKQRKRKNSFVSILHDHPYYYILSFTLQWSFRPNELIEQFFFFFCGILQKCLFFKFKMLTFIMSQDPSSLSLPCFVTSVPHRLWPCALPGYGLHQDESCCLARFQWTPFARITHLSLSAITAYLPEIPSQDNNAHQASSCY